ncbi:hypothetical protein [Robiginitomaculum antarcticum]|uniref:hypothetical protein n=1 Tax=Robiginitomaculum antarcticum TaxID=437507 RepID=UPI00036008AD|nr:hypothetical protein [Robiginitomaculum antarcticum]
MQYFKTLILPLAVFAVLPATASAAGDATTCKIYGKIGGAITDFMLPLTMQDLVNILTDKDPVLSTKMTTVIVEALDTNDIVSLTELGDEAAGLMGEAAGQVAIELLMSGQASSGAEIVSIMDSTCQSVGFEGIISNQRDARNSLSKIMGE